MLWEVDIHPAQGQPNRLAEEAVAEARDLGFPSSLAVEAARGYLIQGDLTREQVLRIAAELLADGVVERTVVAQVGDDVLTDVPGTKPGATREAQHPSGSRGTALVHVLPKPGVTDPVAESTRAAIADFNIRADAVRTFKKYWIAGLDEAQLQLLSAKVLANDAIEQVIIGPLTFEHLEVGSPYRFELVTVPLRALD
ncbi:MAG: phosphoribosylformylglycinamidine synthase, partial [Pirellulaceae bacterium]|nr:phosphoribosylformylglycinamidine synthase [Pirellulaceae bacterium]